MEVEEVLWGLEKLLGVIEAVPVVLEEVPWGSLSSSQGIHEDVPVVLSYVSGVLWGFQWSSKSVQMVFVEVLGILVERSRVLEEGPKELQSVFGGFRCLMVLGKVLEGL